MPDPDVPVDQIPLRKPVDPIEDAKSNLRDAHAGTVAQLKKLRDDKEFLGIQITQLVADEQKLARMLAAFDREPRTRKPKA